jgi:GR25 family glycosyltransferase involved in LPS biosynthesis
MKNLCIICLVCILILIWCLFYIKIETFKNNETNFDNTGMYVLYIPKREKYIKNVMNKLKLNPEFVKGFDKNNLDLNKLIKNNKVLKQFAKEDNIGRIACNLGHINILNKFLKSDNKFALILEDDIAVDKYDETTSKIINLTNNIPPDAEIVYFGYCTESCSVAKKYNELFFHSVNPNCRHCYLVTKLGAKKIIDNIYPINMNGDQYMRTLISSKKIKAYNANYEYFTIKQNRDEMGSELNNNQTLRECKEMK